MLYNFRFKNPYSTIGGAWIYEVKAAGETMNQAERNAINLIESCIFLTQETKDKMIENINQIMPSTCDAVFVMG